MAPSHFVRHWRVFGAFLALLAVAPLAGLAQSDRNVLAIETSSGSHPFNVDVMRSQPDLEKGLMFRKSIPADYGMLFDFQREQNIMMWMKNTFIPLDMIFMDKTGKVVGIIANAEPMSEKILSVGVPTDAVLEVRGGTAARIGLKVGDRVRDAIFTP
ncbi:DUF192 domain-containing protein [uncultured Methylovirgula sp.]|uniref:DUF192 domain-containing protein n=1 Tax=uncultured Methylovirgula sp. TaxID=1285960 RepID=UPI00262A901B|nr:DUF192 domain-containing protein [uncultured Methylovirgula sp.]